MLIESLVKSSLQNWGFNDVDIVDVPRSGSFPIALHREGTSTWWKAEFCYSDGKTRERDIRRAASAADRIVDVHGGTFAVIVENNASIDSATLVPSRVPSRPVVLYVRPHAKPEDVQEALVAFNS